MRIDGVMTLRVYHKDGTVGTVTKHNSIVASGFDAICECMGNSGNSMSKIMVGSGTVDTEESMTVLYDKIAEKAAAYAHTTGTKVFTMSTDFLEGEAVGAINEAGVFNTDDIMFDRVTFKTMNIDATDRVSIKFEFTLA